MKTIVTFRAIRDLGPKRPYSKQIGAILFKDLEKWRSRLVSKTLDYYGIDFFELLSLFCKTLDYYSLAILGCFLYFVKY